MPHAFMLTTCATKKDILSKLYVVDTPYVNIHK